MKAQSSSLYLRVALFTIFVPNMKTNFFLLATMLCFSILFSCTDVQRDNPDDEKSINHKGSSSSLKSSSSSARASSSSSKPSSSSSVKVSSSSSISSGSVSPYRLVCEVNVDTGIADEPISEYDMPEVMCIINKEEFFLEPEYDFEWIDAPNWDAPKAGTYSKIKVKVNNDAEVCQGLTATCSGTLTILKGISSNSTPRSSSSAFIYSSSSKPSSSSSTTSSGGGGNCKSGETRGDMCLWNAGGDCWPLSGADEEARRSNCAQNAWIFQGGAMGEDTGCRGGTFICGKDNNPPKGGAPSLGCCHWETESDCWDIYTEEDVIACGEDNNKFSNTPCPNKGGTCPSSIK